jgi:hypothetical protein
MYMHEFLAFLRFLTSHSSLEETFASTTGLSVSLQEVFHLKRDSKQDGGLP